LVFRPNIDMGLPSTISISFVSMTPTIVWVGLCKNMSSLGRMSCLYGLFNMVSTWFKNRYHPLKKLGFCLTQNNVPTLGVCL
jgi:hypothetical protein